MTTHGTLANIDEDFPFGGAASPTLGHLQEPELWYRQAMKTKTFEGFGHYLFESRFSSLAIPGEQQLLYRSGKRAMELIQMYLMDYANLEEVIALLGVEKTAK